jgi:predicted metalloprotease
VRWQRTGRSRNLEDRRGQRSRRAAPISLGAILLLLLLSAVFKTDFFALLSDVGGGLPQQSGTAAPPADLAAEEELVQFVSFVLDDNQATWAQLLDGYGEARLVLFRDAVESGCGYASSATGPFYCPADRRLYLDLGFFEELRRRFGAPGDFAQAYVIAHEIGHHVQNQLGIEAQVRDGQRRDPSAANRLSVRMELQADCFAGVWGHSTHERGLLEDGDVEEGLGAAAAIGDDRLQRHSGGAIRPEAFTHGTSEQRARWLRTGLASGDPEACDTFGRPDP